MPFDSTIAPIVLFALRVSHARPTSRCLRTASCAYLFNSNADVAQACTAVAFRTFAMREGLRRAVSATSLRHAISEWPVWTPEVLTYVAVFGQGLPNPEPSRMDSASCSMLAAVLMHKDALATAAAAEGLRAGDTRASIPKLAVLLLLDTPYL